MNEANEEKKEINLIDAADNALKNRVRYKDDIYNLDCAKGTNAKIHREKARNVPNADDDRPEKEADQAARRADPY